MTVTKLNDAEILQQLDGQWQKMAMLLLWKLAGRKMVTLTHMEIKAFNDEFSPGIPVMFTHGHSDSIDFQVIDEAAARVIAGHNATMQGARHDH
ncbi:MAG: hypothetical protein WAO76_07335 [Georgfuchsia sp.]